MGAEERKFVEPEVDKVEEVKNPEIMDPGENIMMINTEGSAPVVTTTSAEQNAPNVAENPT